MNNTKRGTGGLSPLDQEVERLLRDVPQSHGGNMAEFGDSWEAEELRSTQARDQAAEEAAMREKESDQRDAAP